MPNISGRLLVEGEQTIDTLCNSIKDMLEIFPKLCGLDGLEVTNLRKKDGNEWVELIMDNLIKNHIKQKDIIYFDLRFSNIWIDIIMTIKDKDNEDKSNKFSFELKTDLKRNNTELELTLINVGIRTWTKFNEEIKDYDFYLLSNIEFEIESENEENSKRNGNNPNDLSENFKILGKKDSTISGFKNDDNKFNFNDKIICTLIFINFSDYIYKYALKEVTKKKESNEFYYNRNNPHQYLYGDDLIGSEKKRETFKSFESNNMFEIKTFFNNYFREIYLNNSQKVIEIDRIICKVSPNYKNEEEETVYSINFDYNSPPNINNNFKVKHVGPFNEAMFHEQKRYQMVEIKDISGKISFMNKKNYESDSSSNNSHNSIDSFDKQPQKGYKEYCNNTDIEEIKFIGNEINYNKVFDQIGAYIISKKLNESDLDRTRNLNDLDADKRKNNKNILDKDEVDKKNSKDIKNVGFSNEDEYYNTNTIKKYSLILIIIILILIIFHN